MKPSTQKSAGAALLIGALSMLATMFLHPSGGNLRHLLNVSQIIIISHSLAILAIPFLCVGFWGLLNRLGTLHFLPLIAFALMLTGLLAGMIAAIINGLALPIYLRSFGQEITQVGESIKPILRNNIALNQAFDFVFLVAVSLSILFWSFAIIQLRKIPIWLGYFGILLSLTAIIMMIAGYVFVNLHGFRLFILLNVVWMSSVGVSLIRLQPHGA